MLFLEEKLTGDKLADDDKELQDKYADTNANPYVRTMHQTTKLKNLNTKTVKRGDKLLTKYGWIQLNSINI